MKSAQPLLSLSNLTLTRNSMAVVTDGHLTVNTGEIVCLVGPNGSGKTTLAEMLAGISPCIMATCSSMFFGKDFRAPMSAEEVVSFKKNINTHALAEKSSSCTENNLLALTPAERARQGLYVAFQNVPEFDGVTAETFLYEAYSACHGERPAQEAFRALLVELCATVGLSFAHLERPLFKGFSGGERKRFQLLELLVLRPKLAVLDELDAGLDAQGLQLFFEIIQKLRDKDFAHKKSVNKNFLYENATHEDATHEDAAYEDAAYEDAAYEDAAYEDAAYEVQERENFSANSSLNGLSKKTTGTEPSSSFLIITHNQAVIDTLAPDRVYELSEHTLKELSEKTIKRGAL
jgi:Fe-S cluster assembly ATP-binding protein